MEHVDENEIIATGGPPTSNNMSHPGGGKQSTDGGIEGGRGSWSGVRKMIKTAANFSSSSRHHPMYIRQQALRSIDNDEFYGSGVTGAYAPSPRMTPAGSLVYLQHKPLNQQSPEFWAASASPSALAEMPEIRSVGEKRRPMLPRGYSISDSYGYPVNHHPQSGRYAYVPAGYGQPPQQLSMEAAYQQQVPRKVNSQQSLAHGGGVTSGMRAPGSKQKAILRRTTSTLPGFITNRPEPKLIKMSRGGASGGPKHWPTPHQVTQLAYYEEEEDCSGGDDIGSGGGYYPSPGGQARYHHPRPVYYTSPSADMGRPTMMMDTGGGGYMTRSGEAEAGRNVSIPEFPNDEAAESNKMEKNNSRQVQPHQAVVNGDSSVSGMADHTNDAAARDNDTNNGFQSQTMNEDAFITLEEDKG